MRILILASFSWQVLPLATDSFFGIKPPTTNFAPGAYTPSPLSSGLSVTTAVILVAVIAKILLSFAPKLPRGRVPELAAAALPGFIGFGSRIDLQTPGALGPILYLSIVIAVWVLRPPLSSLSIVAWIAFYTSALSMLFAVFAPHTSLMPSTRTPSDIAVKDLLGISVLSGPFNHGNTLGMMLACSLPTLAFVKPRTRVLVAAAILPALLWSQSRTAISATIITVTAYVLIVALPRELRPAAGSAVGFTLILISATVPFYFAGTNAFTGRGQIWGVTLDAWRDSPVLGLGFEWFSQPYLARVPIRGALTQGHNLWTHSLVTGGLLYAGAIAALLASAIARSGRWLVRGQYFPFGFLTIVLTISIAEVPFGFGERWVLLEFVTLPLLAILFSPLRFGALQQNRDPGKVTT